MSRATLGRSVGGILLVFLLSLTGWSSDTTANPSGKGQDKVALLVGISDYPSSGGWGPLHTEQDLRLIREGLELHGFEPGNIHELVDEEADREGIETAFREYLIEGAGRGAVAVFHYSGHGQQITDDDHDEIDGYDEALVPVDAPARGKDYDGGKHLRDDDLNALLMELRRKLGPKGDVLVSLDSCFSGAATRGPATRGSLVPLGPPQAQGDSDEVVEDRGGGAVEGTGAASRGGAKLAGFTFISAARHDEPAFETEMTKGGDKVGSLSFALGRALSDAGTETTYAGLHSEVRRLMASEVKNVPQLEGDPNRKILGGKAISQKPYYSIISYENKVAQVRGGQLAGLRNGSKVAVYPVDTPDPKGKTPLARGVVRKSKAITSEVLFDNVVEGADIAAGWLFVTEASFGDVPIRVYFGDGAWRPALLEYLEGGSLIEQAESAEASEVVVETGSGGVEVKKIDGTPLGDPIAADDDLPGEVRQRLEDYARNQWLKRIKPRSSDIQVSMKIRPCQLVIEEDDMGESIKKCGADLEGRNTEGGFELRVDDGIEITLENVGREAAHITLLELMPDGRIDQIYPPRDRRGADNLLDPKKKETILGQIAPPLGSNMYKLFATRDPVDFHPILSDQFSSGTRGAGLDGFLKGAFDGTRGTNATVQSGPVSTTSTTFTISNAEEQ